MVPIHPSIFIGWTIQCRVHLGPGTYRPRGPRQWLRSPDPWQELAMWYGKKKEKTLWAFFLVHAWLLFGVFCFVLFMWSTRSTVVSNCVRGVYTWNRRMHPPSLCCAMNTRKYRHKQFPLLFSYSPTLLLSYSLLLSPTLEQHSFRSSKKSGRLC